MAPLKSSHTAVPSSAPSTMRVCTVGHRRGLSLSAPPTKKPIAPGRPHADTTPTTPGRTRIIASSPTSSAPPDRATSTVTSATEANATRRAPMLP